MNPRRLAPWLIAIAAVLVVAAAVATRPEAGIETGVVVAVDARGLGDIRSFRLRTDDGRTVDFVVRGLENAAQFPPAHLVEHLSSSEPVVVRYRIDGGDRVAYRIEDGP